MLYTDRTAPTVQIGRNGHWILWRGEDGANHVEWIAGISKDAAVARGLRLHPDASHIRPY